MSNKFVIKNLGSLSILNFNERQGGEEDFCQHIWVVEKRENSA